MSRKIIVRLKGGLGNQMFCYAIARRLAWANDAELVLDAVSGFKYDHLYQRTYALHIFFIPARLANSCEQMEPLGLLRRYIARKISEGKPLAKRRYIQQVGVDFDPSILTLRLQDGTTYFDAFGQSESYFTDIQELLLRDFAMSLPSGKMNQEMGKQIKANPSVAIHFRWFDSGNTELTSNISLDYYSRAITKLITKVDRPHFFIFSDKPNQTEKLLRPLMQGHSYTVVRHNLGMSNGSVDDFWLMRQCQHFIIGNSTFAWWAAWLTEIKYSNTLVFAPGRKIDPAKSITAWGFPGQLPERWTIL
jgi:hypothetical protein